MAGIGRSSPPFSSPTPKQGAPLKDPTKGAEKEKRPDGSDRTFKLFRGFKMSDFISNMGYFLEGKMNELGKGISERTSRIEQRKGVGVDGPGESSHEFKTLTKDEGVLGKLISKVRGAVSRPVSKKDKNVDTKDVIHPSEEKLGGRLTDTLPQSGYGPQGIFKQYEE